MKYADPLIDVQRFGNLAARTLTRLAQNQAGMCTPARSNFIGDVLHFEYV